MLKVYMPTKANTQTKLIEYLRGLIHSTIELRTEEDAHQDFEYELLIAGRPKAEHLQSSPSLRAAIVPFAGVPPETRQALKEYPKIQLHNSHHNAVPTAEHALALMFACSKNIVTADQQLRNNDWHFCYEEGGSILCSGKTALILGYGAVGKHIAKLCAAIGLKLLATRAQIEEPYVEDSVEIHPMASLADLLPQANFLFLALPLTKQTKGLIGASEFSLLKSSSILINVARGEVVQEEALFNALSKKQIHGAGIDVWYQYPKEKSQRSCTEPANYDFASLNNIVLSPHHGGNSDGTEKLRAQHLAKMLNQAASGKELANKICQERAY